MATGGAYTNGSGQIVAFVVELSRDPAGRAQRPANFPTGKIGFVSIVRGWDALE